MGKLRRVMIMAGGTGGHVFPGLAVAKLMREQNIEVHWLGTKTGFEAKAIPEAGFPLHYISIGGVRGKKIKTILIAPFRIIFATVQALRILKAVQPDVVLGMGGFASGPGGLAAWLLRVPLIIHEQNAKAGLTNSLLARIATKILEGFPRTFFSKKVVTVGNPVRKEIINIPAPDLRFNPARKPLRLLVLGGSLGAQAINEIVPQALAKMPESIRPEVYHQTGEKLFEAALQAYRAHQVTANVVPFIREMNQAYEWADIVLCRAGALTIAELCAVGLGAILVPFPLAVGDHQTDNANFMAKEGAAFLVQQKELTVEKLIAMLMQFSERRDQCLTMAKAAYGLRRIDATEKVLSICKENLR